MRLTVCQLHDAPHELERDWASLVDHARQERADVVLLPEMGLAPWFAVTPRFDAATWRAAVEGHERWIARFPELGASMVLGTRPIDRDGRRFNEAFVWTAEAGARGVHLKSLLPREPGFHESDWYHAGPHAGDAVSVDGLRLGFQICTEMWSMGRAQAYGKAGVHLIAVPRATSRDSAEKWLAGGRVAAIVSGAYVASSMRVTTDRGVDLGGSAFIVHPDGLPLAVSTPDAPFVTADIDVSVAEGARATYPRYALE